MNTHADYYLNSNASVAELEFLQISHPSFSRVYSVVRNYAGGVSVTHEDGAVVEYEHYPLEIRPSGVRSDLDYGVQVQLGDLGEIIPDEIAAVLSDDTIDVRPVVVYRTYRSDDLTAPISGPITLEVSAVTRNADGSGFSASAPRVNISGTGRRYSNEAFPGLRGFF